MHHIIDQVFAGIGNVLPAPNPRIRRILPSLKIRVDRRRRNAKETAQILPLNERAMTGSESAVFANQGRCIFWRSTSYYFFVGDEIVSACLGLHGQGLTLGAPLLSIPGSPSHGQHFFNAKVGTDVDVKAIGDLPRNFRPEFRLFPSSQVRLYLLDRSVLTNHLNRIYRRGKQTAISSDAIKPSRRQAVNKHHENGKARSSLVRGFGASNRVAKPPDGGPGLYL